MYLTSVFPQPCALALRTGWFSLIRTALMLSAVAFAAGAVLRLCFGKQAKVTRAVSASLSIVLVYLTAVLLYLLLPDSRAELAALPFLTVDSQRFALWQISGLSEGLLYSALLRLFLLAFLVNLLDTLFPQGDRFLSWYLWRSATALAGLGLYLLACGLLTEYAPGLLTVWAKTAVLGFWALILMSGIAKLLMTLILTAVNPIIGGLYAFFFSSPVGSHFSRALLTTLILVALLSVLNRMGFSQFAFSDFSLLSYGPVCLICAGTLYLFGRFL